MQIALRNMHTAYEQVAHVCTINAEELPLCTLLLEARHQVQMLSEANDQNLEVVCPTDAPRLASSAQLASLN